ncbi:hypothetical protein ACH4E7_33870 [Kitasatospora sp. NPDC018058]|uniref:hypothetical protein n=1 Tax=Kitasatospora sp. NPDC018058 TaxID=3364025 RepID=UPI0037C153B4
MRADGVWQAPEVAARALRPALYLAVAPWELVAALVSAPGDPWWEVRVLHEKLCPPWKRGAFDGGGL